MRAFEGHKDDVRSVCLSADGRYAISGSDDKTLKLWDVSTGQCLRTFEGHSDTLCSVSLSASPIMSLALKPITLCSVSLSADGRYVISANDQSATLDMSLKLWDVSTGQCLRTFEGHSDFVLSVCLSADGKYALSGSSDKTLKLWEVSTGQCLRTFEGHSGPVNSVCLSADGRYAISGGQDGTIKLWRLIWKLEFD